MQSSRLWWLNAHNSPRRSTSLQSTIRELDEKTVSMLRIIEEDADSFTQRADMYYRKRPQLVSMVEDLYRSHRSLAEKLYAAKLESHSHPTRTGSPKACFMSKMDEPSSAQDQCFDTYTDSLDSDQYSTESEVDDPEQAELDDEMEALDEVEMIKLREEIERLRMENRVQQEELVRKDEEKREVIRQLSSAVDMMKQENRTLRKSLTAKDKKWNIPEFGKVFFFRSC